MSDDRYSSSTISIEHVTINSDRSFDEVRSALESAVPSLDEGFIKLLMDGKVDEAKVLLDEQATLSIFGMRDHGSLLMIANQSRKAIQYDIGNPLTASKMSRHVISAAMYAPIRVLLREDDAGKVGFEYDRPAHTFGQFDSPEVNSVAIKLDDDLREILERAAS